MILEIGVHVQKSVELETKPGQEKLFNKQKIMVQPAHNKERVKHVTAVFMTVQYTVNLEDGKIGHLVIDHVAEEVNTEQER